MKLVWMKICNMHVYIYIYIYIYILSSTDRRFRSIATIQLLVVRYTICFKLVLKSGCLLCLADILPQSHRYSQRKERGSLYIYIYIMSCRQHGYPWPSLATSPYHSSPPAGLQSYILCPHIVAVCKFVLVVLLLHIHMWGSTGVHRLWARPCFSSSVPRVWFV